MTPGRRVTADNGIPAVRPLQFRVFTPPPNNGNRVVRLIPPPLPPLPPLPPPPPPSNPFILGARTRAAQMGDTPFDRSTPNTVQVDERFRKWTPMESFLPTNVALVIGEKRVHVNKEALAAQSDYFNALFFGDFKEANESEIEIKEVSHEDFVLVLGMLYIHGPDVTDRNVETVVLLADRFGIQSVKDKAEKFLLDSSVLNKHTKLRLSDQYCLIHLQEAMLLRYKTMSDLHDLKQSEEYNLISNEMKLKMYESM